jgi:SAM-dependent methyltransferase
LSSYWSDLGHHGWDEIWMNHPAVRAAINRRVTGDAALWPIAWLPSVVPDRIPFSRALSVGCGVGNFERTLVEFGIVRRVTGIDASMEVIGEARRSAAEAGMGERITYAAADAREFLRSERDLDAVFFHASLHHFDRLPEFLGLVRQALSPRGILYLDEYAGPSRDQWGWRDLLRWNAAYWRLPRAVRRTGIVRAPISREDPTEAIESSGILPAVAEHFRLLARRDYGGNLLAVIYPSLLRPNQPGGPPPEVFDAAVADLLRQEEKILERGPGFHTVVVAQTHGSGSERGLPPAGLWT